MLQSAKQSIFDGPAYLIWEEKQQQKFEYIAGEVFAMGGARREHVLVSGNIYAWLKQQLRGKPCMAYIADMKLHIEPADAFFYPDVMVSCDQQDNQAEQFLSHPSLIVEVLSDSTASFDRGDKFVAYRCLASLQEYVIVDIKTRRIECYRRTTDNDWLLHDYANDDVCEFKSLDLSLPLSECFEDLAEQNL